MKNHQETTTTPKELLHELQALVAEAETLMADSLSEHSAEAFGNLRDRFGAARERLSSAYAGARQRVIAGAHCVDDTVRANPYQSLAVAAGIGLLVGALVGVLAERRRA